MVITRKKFLINIFIRIKPTIKRPKHMFKKGYADKAAREDIENRRRAQTKGGVDQCHICGKTIKGISYWLDNIGGPQICQEDAVSRSLSKEIARIPLLPGWSLVSEPGIFPMLQTNDKQVHVEEAYNEIWGIDESYEDDNPIKKEGLPTDPNNAAHKIVMMHRKMTH